MIFLFAKTKLGKRKETIPTTLGSVFKIRCLKSNSNQTWITIRSSEIDRSTPTYALCLCHYWWPYRCGRPCCCCCCCCCYYFRCCFLFWMQNSNKFDQMMLEAKTCFRPFLVTVESHILDKKNFSQTYKLKIVY